MNYKKIVKRLIPGAVLCVISLPVILFVAMIIDKKTNVFVVYWEDKFHHQDRAFIVNAFKKISPAAAGQTNGP